MKRIVQLLRTAILLFLLIGSVPIASGQTNFIHQGIEYAVTSPTTVAVVQSWTGNYSGDIVIPSEITKLTNFYNERVDRTFIVTSVDESAFSYCVNLTSIVLPNTIKTIGQYAFYGCTQLSSVTLSNGLEIIGSYAFAHCSSLTSIELPNSVHSLSWNAFYYCTSLFNVTLPDNIWELNGTFVGCSNLSSINIPSNLVSIDGAFTDCSSLPSLVIPSSVTYIGAKTFQNCSSLSSVYLPNSVSQIGNYAFNNTGLTAISIPNTVTNIGENTFQGCNKLVSITSRPVTPPALAKSNTFSQWIYNNAQLVVPQVALNTYKSTDWWNLFKNMTGDQSLNTSYDFEDNGIYYIKLDDTTVEVTYKDTNYNSYSGNVTVPATVSYGGKTYNVTRIGYNAFYHCSGLTGISLPASVTSISTGAFNGCYGLTRLTIPQNIKSIGAGAFDGCIGLTQLVWNAKNCLSNGDMTTSNINKVTIGDNVVVLPIGFVANAKITSVNLPNSVSLIGGHAFEGCKSISSLTIPVDVSCIGDSAFAQCNGLTHLTWNARECWFNGNMYTNNLTAVTIGNNVRVLPERLADNSKITAVTIPSSVVRIGGFAFNSCTNLGEINLSSGLISIATYAFYHCTGIQSLTIPSNVEIIDEYAFEGCSGITQLTWNARDCVSNGEMTTENITKATIGNEVKTIPDCFVSGSKITSIDIPNSVTVIGNGAFYGCSGLTSVTLPDGVTTISSEAFGGCTGLTSVTIPDSVTSIDSRAFSNCTGLTSVTIPDAVTRISGYAFSNCTGLTNVTIPDAVITIGDHAFYNCTGLTSVTIGASVEIIGQGAFSNCTGLTSVTIPDAVTRICEYAFSYCTGLTSVTIGASVEYIEVYAFSYCTSLTKVLCLPLTPPTIDSFIFYVVPSTMTVYVFPSALEAYQSNYYWNIFTIEPANFDVSNLTIHLPNGTDVAQYANMKLAIAKEDSDQTLHYIINDKLSYTFANLDKNTVWDVVLTNQYGDEFGKIEDVVVGEEDAAVTFPSLKKPQTVTLKVKTPSGQDVTAQTKITWKDENGELLVQSNQIAGLPAGRKLNYSVTLPQELATAYALPADMSYTVKDGDNTIVCQLTAIAQAKLSGKVKEATSNQPIYSASISATQSFAGGYSNTLTTTTDNQGLYTLDALSAPTTLTIAAQGYISQTLDCDELMTGGNNITIPDVVLQPITGAVVNVNLSFTPVHAIGETVETQNWYNDYVNVDYEVYNKTTGHIITNISVQYPQIVLLEDVNDGDVLELTASSRKDAFMPVKTTVTIAEQRATATFNILEWGQVMAKFMKNINPKVRGSLYDAENKFVMGADYTGSTLTIDNLPDGSYKLITMGKSDFFNSIYDLDQFDNAGLIGGEDYVKNNVQVESGIVSEVTIDEVPFFDESKFYYTESPTSFTVNKPNIVVGNYMTFRLQVDFKEQYADKVSNVQLIIDLPESCSFIENSVLIGASSGPYVVQGNQITIQMSMAEQSNVVRFCAIPTEIGQFAPSAFVKFKLNGKTITQPIGNANFIARGLSISVASTVNKTNIPIGGTAIGECDITIYDNDVLIGQTQSLANGSWMTNCELHKPYNLSRHNIYAKVKTSQGVEVQTEMAYTLYDKNSAQVSMVTQYNEQRGPTPYLITFDFLNPSTSSQHYSYDMYDDHKTFSYTIDFTNNKNVDNVMLYVKTNSGHWWPLAATYDEGKDLWVTAGEFGDSKNEDLPLNVAVDYFSKTKNETDRDLVDEEINAITQKKNELDSLKNAHQNLVIQQDEEYQSLSVKVDQLESLEEQINELSETENEDGMADLIALYCTLLGVETDAESIIPDPNALLDDQTALELINYCAELLGDNSDDATDLLILINRTIDEFDNSIFETDSIDFETLFVNSDTIYYEKDNQPYIFYQAKFENLNWNDVDTVNFVHLPMTSGKDMLIYAESDNVIILDQEKRLAWIAQPSNVGLMISTPLRVSGSEIIQSLRNAITDVQNIIDRVFEWATDRSDEIKSEIKTLEDQLLKLEDDFAQLLVKNAEKANRLADIERQLELINQGGGGVIYYGELDAMKAQLAAERRALLLETNEISKSITKAKEQISRLKRSRFLKLAVLGTISEYYAIVEGMRALITYGNDGISDISNWNAFINSILPCDEDKFNAMVLQSVAEGNRGDVGRKYLAAFAISTVSNAINLFMTFNPAAQGASRIVKGLTGIVSGFLNEVAGHFYQEAKSLSSSLMSERLSEKSKLNCKKDDEQEPKGEPYPGPDMTFCIDPSGFVYEGVPSNRLEGVTATCYYKETVEDMYGDLHEEVVLWDAENYGQENPLLTDQNGYYRWDVPVGMWQVKYEKAGYETTYSDWLPVPPPQLDVNIGMVQMRQPEVIKARAYNKAVEFEFDKFMLPEDLTTDNITVLNDYGNAVTGTIELLNAEVDDPNAITSIRRAPGTGLTLASKVRFNSNSRFYQYATLKVSKRVKSYAGLEMNEDYVIKLPVEYEMEKIVVDSTLNLLYGDSRQLTVTVEPAMASRGKTLNVRTMSPMILSNDAESYTLDYNGQAVVTVHGDLPGMGSLLYDIDGYDLSAATLVNVMMESQMTVATPTATIASGSEVEKGTTVYLRCSTEGATIYYTLDGSCPCDNTPARKVYDGSPIIIDRTMTIKAMATAPDLYDSDVATFVYRISNGLRGDVNGDGEVNIADVNAVIGVILGIRTDEDIISRADVNGDGEVNIADVNEIIRIILGTSNGVMLDVNCDDALHLDDVQLRPGEVKTLNVTLDNAMRYSALQCDIVLPAGLTLVDVNTTNGSVSKSGMTSDTTTRVMIYSMSKRQFTGNGSGVLTMTVRADDSLPSDSKITLTHVVLADNQDKAWHSADCTASVNNTSGINDLTAGNDRVWVEGRTLCIRTQQDGIARLTTINGIVHELDVKSGVTRHMLDAGIYVVVLNGNSYKIAVK